MPPFARAATICALLGSPAAARPILEWMETPYLAEYRGDGLIRVRPSLLVHGNGEAALVTGATFTESPLTLVHDPEGGWHLDDGVADDPLIVIMAPSASDYAIFLGTHGTTRLTRPGTLIISETTP